ncbi:MAG: cupin domain-containing protein [Acidobacteriota bacterium]
MNIERMSKRSVIAIGLFSLLVSNTVQAATQVIAAGTMAYSDLFGGPANITVRRVTIGVGDVLGWHYHPGVGAYTVVVRGALTIEDGCGGEEIFTVGQAFLEAPNRVHRGKNFGSVEVETIQTLIVPVGTPISVSTGQLCGAPAAADACKNDGWTRFTHPRSFRSQGDCVQYVISGH